MYLANGRLLAPIIYFIYSTQQLLFLTMRCLALIRCCYLHACLSVKRFMYQSTYSKIEIRRPIHTHTYIRSLVCLSKCGCSLKQMNKNVRKRFKIAYAEIVNRVERVGGEVICRRLFFSFENIFCLVCMCVFAVERNIISKMNIVCSDVINIWHQSFAAVTAIEFVQRRGQCSI